MSLVENRVIMVTQLERYAYLAMTPVGLCIVPGYRKMSVSSIPASHTDSKEMNPMDPMSNDWRISERQKSSVSGLKRSLLL